VATKKDFERNVNIMFIRKGFNDYRNFRPAVYPDGRLPAPIDFSQKGKKESADYPHWCITQKQKKIVLKSSRPQR